MKASVIEVRDMLSVLSLPEVERRIGKVASVESVTVNYAAGSATVRYDETRLEIVDIKLAVRQSGYQSAGESPPKHVSERKPARKGAVVPTPEAAPAPASTPVAAVPKAATVAPVAKPAPAAPAVDGHKGHTGPGAPPPPRPPAMAKAGRLDDPSVKNADEVARALGADIKNGLTSAEASRRLAQDGPNELRSAPRRPAWRRVLSHFHDPLVYLLLAAIAIALVAWVIEGLVGWPVDAIVIGTIVLLNGILGYVQEALGCRVCSYSQFMRASAVRMTARVAIASSRNLCATTGEKPLYGRAQPPGRALDRGGGPAFSWHRSVSPNGCSCPSTGIRPACSNWRKNRLRHRKHHFRFCNRGHARRAG